MADAIELVRPRWTPPGGGHVIDLRVEPTLTLTTSCGVALSWSSTPLP